MSAASLVHARGIADQFYELVTWHAAFSLREVTQTVLGMRKYQQYTIAQQLVTATSWILFCWRSGKIVLSKAFSDMTSQLAQHS